MKGLDDSWDGKMELGKRDLSLLELGEVGRVDNMIVYPIV